MFVLLPPNRSLEEKTQNDDKSLCNSQVELVVICIRSWKSFLLQSFSIAKASPWKLFFQRAVQYKQSSFCRRETINEKHMLKMQIPISYLQRCHIKKKSQIIVRNISIDFSYYILSSSVDWKFTVNSFANFCCRQLIYCNLQLASFLLQLLREESSGKHGPNTSLVLQAQFSI